MDDLALGASARTATLSLQGPAQDCVTVQDLRASVEARLGRPVFVEAANADVELLLTLTPPSSSGWQVSLRVRGRDVPMDEAGIRTLDLDTSSCADVREAVALVVTIALDPDPPVSAPPPPPPSTPPSQDVADVVAKPRREPWTVSVAAGGLLSGGSLPGVAGGGVLLGRLSPALPWPALELGLRAIWSEPVTDLQGGRLDMRALGTHLFVCPELAQSGRVKLGACTGMALDLVTAEGSGFDQSRQVSNMTPALALGIDVSFELARSARGSSLSGFGRVQGQVALLKRSYVFETRQGARDVAFDPADAGIGAILGLTWGLFHAR